MAFVRVEERNAHLAAPVRLDYVNGRDGKVAKATLTAISNTRRGSSEERDAEATAIQWTLWGRQAENAAEHLGKGSHVNVVGRVRNNNYEADGKTVYGLAFTCEEIDFLDTRAEAEWRKAGEGGETQQGSKPAEAGETAQARSDEGKAGKRSRN